MMRPARRAAMAGAAALATALAACGSKGGAAATPAPAVVDTTTFAPDLAVDLRQFTRAPLGYYFLDTKKGTGPVAADGRKARIRYAAYLPDGKLVDGVNQPIEVDIGESIIKGLRYGLIGMQQGGQRRLVLPPSLGYGRQQHGNIPPNSVLVFDLDLVSIR